MAGSKVIRFTFFMLMGAIIAALLFQIFFQIEIDGHEGGALVYLSRQAEIPMAQYYYTYSYVPNTVSTYDTDTQLGFNCVNSAIFTTSNNICLDSNIDSGNYEGNDDVFATIHPSTGIYSTGWSD